MSWDDILKLDKYIEMRLKDLYKELSNTKDPTKRRLIKGSINYWERVKRMKDRVYD